MGRQLTNLWKERIRKVPFLGVSVVLCHLFAVPLIYAIPVRWIMRDSVVKAYWGDFLLLLVSIPPWRPDAVDSHENR